VIRKKAEGLELTRVNQHNAHHSWIRRATPPKLSIGKRKDGSVAAIQNRGLDSRVSRVQRIVDGAGHARLLLFAAWSFDSRNTPKACRSLAGGKSICTEFNNQENSDVGADGEHCAESPKSNHHPTGNQ